MADLLSDEDVASKLQGSDWKRDGDEIVREWKFKDFGEEANHHPDILLHGWNKVRLSLTNHSAGGLTAADFEMAERFDAL